SASARVVLDLVEVGFFMAIVTGGGHRLEHQVGVVRCMGRVAGSTIPAFHGLMLELGLRDLLLQVVMAIEAQLRAGLGQQLLVVGLVWVMAGGTFPILHRLMLHLGLGDLLLEVVVAIGAQLPVGLVQQLFVVGLVRVVAGGAVAVFDWLM